MTRASISLGLGTNGHSPARGCIEKADSICEGRGLYRRAAEVNAVEASFPVESSTWLSWLLRRYGKKVKRELVTLGTAGMAVYFFFVYRNMYLLHTQILLYFNLDNWRNEQRDLLDDIGYRSTKIPPLSPSSLRF